ncbi:coenzyme F420 hydrogenase subunit beta [Methanocella paludicola SANAE]|uniref:Coenzyme F420 hydrogenase subunit beta n=1 Tax=Methanocella paludicola (strain DSM 17711 / JCM 13418 / NBRC 101707 / SANAE) TaxID=304371 RepID=D1Z1B2_METPS|nr:coenzyme F420 hydrogenase subunit beta [Methanocella paludicola]BAI62484.1 coenzyme F420 hydrogenase subunit beta [Methanocella paludicola SANAE]
MSFGTYKEVMALKAKDGKIGGVAQDGGVVTTLLCYALEKGVIDGALVAGKSETPWMPKPTIATTKEEIIAAAGTKYTISPVVSTIKDAAREYGLEKIAVVGTPCQIYAVQKMRLYGVGARHIPDKVAMTVGIFCTENFSYAGLRTVIEDHCKVPIESVTKMEIGKGKFWVKGAKDVSIPIKETHKYEQDGCHVCSDLTAEFADISTGSIGTPDGWSTTFARSTRGKDLLSKAIADGLFEKKSMDEFKSAPDAKIKSGLDLLGNLEKGKKDKAKKHFDERKALGLFVTPEILY